MFAPYDGVGIEVHILFEQKFVCSFERSSRTGRNFLNSHLGLVLTDFRQLIEYPRYR